MDKDAAPIADPRKVWSRELRVMLGKSWEDTDVPSRLEKQRIDEGPSRRQPPRRDDWDVGTPEGDRRAAELWRKVGTPDRALEDALAGVRSRYTLDRTAAIDQISGKAFSGVRQAQLRELPESGHLAAGYGLKAAGQPGMGDLKKTSGIRIQQDLSTGYMREQLPEGEASPFPALYKLRTGHAPGPMVRFLNSRLAYEKMVALRPKELKLPPATALLGLPDEAKPVCWAIELPAELTEQRGVVDELMHSSGATPSTHAALQKLGGLAGTNPPDIKDRVPTVAPRGASFDSGPGRKLAELPAGHAAKATAESARHLLSGLKISAEAAADRLVANALATLDKLVLAMAGCVDQAERLNQLYELFMEEIYLVTARARPYTADDYRAGATAALKQRAPEMTKGLAPDVEIKPFLVASGMDALSTALVGAMAGRAADSPVDRSETDNTYFENINLLKHSQAVKGEGPVMVATLNGSTPAHGDKRIDEVGGPIEKIEQKLAAFPAQLVTLILDVTIETGAPGGANGETDLNLVFGNAAVKRALNAGLLGITLCKSYQKYATMGTGKIMAGNVTLVGKAAASAATASRLAQSETDRDAAHSEELQLMTHLLTQGGDDELALLQHAAANARAVHAQSWPPPKKGEGFQDGLPFLMAPVEVTVKGQPMNTTELCARMGLDLRESFSFQQSSCLLAGDSVRINTGQESEAGAIEKLHAVGMAMKGAVEGPALKADIDQDLKGIAASADRFAISKTASKLLLGARVVRPEDPAERQALQAQLRGLLALDDKAGPTLARLTPETRGALQAECLRLALDNPPPDALERNDKDIAARQESVGKTLRDAYTGSGGWHSSGGRRVLVALGEFKAAPGNETAAALVRECEDWLKDKEHGPKDPARPEIEALLKKARVATQHGVVREMIDALPGAENVGRFVLDSLSDELLDRSDGPAILDACLNRLDLHSRIALLAHAASKNRPKLAAALTQRLGPLLTADAPPRGLAPETLADTPEDAPAPSMSGAAFVQARQDYAAARNKDWAALLDWLKAPEFKGAPWVERLQALAAGFEAKAAEIARIADLPGRQRGLAAAATLPGLAGSLVAHYAEALRLKIEALVRDEEAREAAALEAERKRIAAEQLAQRVAAYEAMSVPALILACPDAGDNAARFAEMHRRLEAALTNVAGTAAGEWQWIKAEWEKVSNLVQGLDGSSPDALARRQQLGGKLGQLYARASGEGAFQLANAPQDTKWKDDLEAAVKGLKIAHRARVSMLVNALKEGPGLADEARALRETLRQDGEATVKAIANNDGLWPR